MQGRKNEKEKIRHKFSTQEYTEITQDLLKILDDLGTDLHSLVSSKIKKQMIQIHLVNIKKAVIYYFNIETQRNSRYIYKNYRNGVKEIFKSTRYLKNNKVNEETKQLIYTKIQLLISKVESQVKYILEIEEMNMEQGREKKPIHDILSS